MKTEESLNVTFDETPPPSKTSPLVDDDLDEEEAIKVTEKKNLENDIEDETLKIDKIVNFEMNMMGELNIFLGLQIKQMEDGIFFNQSKYIKEMLKKFGLEDSKPMKTLISSDTKLTKDEESSKSDIMFSVCLCARFQEDPKTSHLEATRANHGMKRCRHSNSASSSSVFVHSSSSHHMDDNDDENKEDTSRACTPSPSRFVNSLSNVVPQVFKTPPHESQTMHTYQTEILNHQSQHQDEHRKGLRSIERALKNMLKGRKK
ncbi:hypothetical protein Tco_0756936 [Tanacetum coccineum]